MIKRPRHASYNAHRRQFWVQIMLPVLVRLNGAGDVGRWAAISTMWLLWPMMIGLIVLLALLVTAIFLATRLGSWLPTYSLRAQKFASDAALGTRRGAEMVRKPVLAMRALGDAAKAGFRRLRERA
jgi:hypothetical protein